jgi:hypothetical protein
VTALLGHKSATPACPQCVPASGQSSPGMIHSIFSGQRQQTLLIAAAHCCKKILHDLDILLNAHEISPFPYIGSRDVGDSADIDAKLLQHYGRHIVAMKGYDLPALEVKNIATRDIYCLARGS